MRLSRLLANLLVIACAMSPSPTLARQGSGTLTTPYEFPCGGDGLVAWGGLVDVGGTLYGTTNAGGAYGRGAVFSVDPTTGAEKLVYSFKANGDAAALQAGVLAVGGLLYGVGNVGGANGYGCVYSADPATGAETILFSFTPAMGGGSGSSLVEHVGYLYNFTGGTDGIYPRATALYYKCALYSTTLYSGTQTPDCFGDFSCGILYSVDLTGGAFSILHSFNFLVDDAIPDAPLVAAHGTLYGSTEIGGAIAYGTLFSYTPGSRSFNSLYTFTGNADGAYPTSPMIRLGGALIGTTGAGATYNTGTIFKLKPQ